MPDVPLYVPVVGRIISYAQLYEMRVRILDSDDTYVPYPVMILNYSS
jgi:hypothetical protein